MSSTDPGIVFDRDVVPAADASRRAGGQALPLGPDVAAESYLVERPRRVLAKADFEWPVVRDVDELRVRLRELWAGDPARLQLVEPLAQLARLPEPEPPSAGDVPDHIYPMY